MKLAPFFTVLSSTDAAGKFLSHDEASQFLSRTGWPQFFFRLEIFCILVFMEISTLFI